jgi:NAD-dependent SIR2 family protein deacetylase
VFYPPTDSRHSVLKLHGSVDWMKCELCGWIVCNDVYSLQGVPYHSASYEQQDADNTCTCGHWPLRPVIIAPSFVRDIRDINILTIWKTAFEELRTADRWFLIGYSLPIDDYAVRSMLIRALKSRKTPPAIEVYQWGESPETESRYRAFFGRDCVYHKDGMEGFIEKVVDARLFL